MLPISKLESLSQRHQELEEMLCQPDIMSDQKRFAQLRREHAELGPIRESYLAYESAIRKQEAARASLSDPDLRELAEMELGELEIEVKSLEELLHSQLLPSDPHDGRNTILEIRAGTGGEEAALFAFDLFRMYSRFAEKKGWKLDVLSTSEASAGGLKEIIVQVNGERVFSQLRFEGGVHRVQRVPSTESQGRIHTSTATVAVLPEADEVDIEIDEKDLQISIAASGGPGGQGVNTTNSAVQILHRPTGMIVKCQDERSQLKNKARAMKVLRARLLDREREAAHALVAEERKGMVGSGERSEKIRTYNFPQNRLTDHRIGLTLHSLDMVMQGDLEPMFTALRNDYQASLLEAEAKNT